MHGSLHFLLTHARTEGQSSCMRHSGLQLGGAPNMPLSQEQTGRLSMIRHSALAPHGEGKQGFVGISVTTAVAKNSIFIKNSQIIQYC
jgi:protein subunit release factor B